VPTYTNYIPSICVLDIVKTSHDARPIVNTVSVKIRNKKNYKFV